jgi:hypothetical protein
MEIHLKIELPEGLRFTPQCPTLNELQKRITRAAANAVVANTIGEAPGVALVNGELERRATYPGAEIAAARCELAKALAQTTSAAHTLDKMLAAQPRLHRGSCHCPECA